ncbi:MAG TPA: hypothetical protein VIQ51_03410 [Chryseosolibacter sp.]
MFKQEIVRFISIICTGLLFASGCSEEPPVSGNAHVQAIFKLKSSTAMEGRISIHEAYLKLSHVLVSGISPGDNVTNFFQSVPPEEPPYQLTRADSGQVNFALPSSAYDQLDLHFYLFQDNYHPVEEEVAGGPPHDNPAPIDPGNDDNQPGQGDDQDDPNDAGEDGVTDDENNDSSDGNEEEDKDHTGDDHQDGEDNDGGDEGDDDDDRDNDDDDDDDGKDDDGKKEKDKNKNKDKKKNKDRNDDDDGRKYGAEDIMTVDLDNFFQNAKPGIVIFGTYDSNGKNLDIIFVVSGVEKISVRAKQNDCFNLELSSQNFAVVTFDLEHLFAGLSPTDIESAPTQLYHGRPLLFIHRDVNSPLFDLFISRLAESANLDISNEFSF